MHIRRAALLLVPAALASVLPAAAQQSELICHTADPTECYPRVFVATDEFQIVRDDQDIPKGLHVRMNLETGRKEAKLYDPREPSDANAVEVVAAEAPTSSPPAADGPGAPSAPDIAQKILSTSGDADGPVRPPPPGSSGAASFAPNLALLQSATTAPAAIRTALADLEDTAHDIYWGQQVCEDGAAVRALAGWLRAERADDGIRSGAALLLGTAAQNNAPARRALLAHEPDLARAVVAALRSPRGSTGLRAHLVYLLSALAPDAGQLEAFVAAGGMDAARAAFRAAAGEHRLRRRLADFFLDHFLAADAAPNREILAKTSKIGLAGELASLCTTFADSLAQMRRGPCADACSAAREHVREAHDALRPVFEEVDPKGAKACFGTSWLANGRRSWEL